MCAAIARNLKEITELLLLYGADINAKSFGGRTPLYTAVIDGDFELMEILLEAGADVNLEADDLTTPLYVATFNEYPEVAEALIKHGALVNKCSHVILLF